MNFITRPLAASPIIVTRNLGPRPTGGWFIHQADGMIEVVVTELPSTGTTQLRFRMQDTTNYWRVSVGNVSDLILTELIAAAGTVRATVSGVVTAGDRIKIFYEGVTIRVFLNDVERITYAAATNYRTRGLGMATYGGTAGTGGILSDLTAYSRDAILPPAG